MHFTNLTHEECDEELFLALQRAMEFKRRLEEWVGQRLQCVENSKGYPSNEEYLHGRVAILELLSDFIKDYRSTLQR